jgi:peptidoglycan hydrolase-like protein with peptidoglycan-binding domain
MQATDRLLHSNRRLLAGTAVLLLVIGVAAAIVDPFAGKASGRGGLVDNGSPISTERVERTSLVSQTQVSGTLGYAGSWTVSVPSGTDPSALAQAKQAVSSARAALSAAQATSTADAQTVRQARAAPRIASAEAALASAHEKAVEDAAQLTSAKGTLANAQQSLAAARASATSYRSASSYTMLPSPGHVVRRGRPLYAIDEQPTLLLYGSTPAWRAFRAGMSNGADVAELNANLRALGYGALSEDAFTPATSAAIAALQQAHDLSPTGTLALGEVVFEPGALRVTRVRPTVGTPVQPGPVLNATSTRHNVSVQIDAAQQSEVKVGDRVTITLPDNSTTPGVVTSVGKVATAPPPGQDATGGSNTPTIDVEIRLLHASAAGHLDEAPIAVSITEHSVRDTLAVPVTALVALAGGGYAVEEVEADGARRLLPVTPGLFDDSAGLVQVSGNGLAVGRRVVVPAS